MSNEPCDRTEYGEPLVTTQNGEAKLVVQDVLTCEATQQSLAQLKLLAIGQGRSIKRNRSTETIAPGTRRA
jgi:hypothetical protein